MARPAIDPATPEKELSSEIVIGMSAPPTRMAKITPNKPDKMVQRIIKIAFATVTAKTAGILKNTTVTSEATIVRPVHNACLLKTTGF